MSFPQAKTLAVNGLAMSCHDLGAGPPVVFCHGWPELAWSWRHQLPAVAAAGYRAIAPDQRGYGNTTGPSGRADCDVRNLCADLVALLDALQLGKAIFCGHDWGGFLIWMLPRLHPDRVSGVIGLNTAFMPRSPATPTTMMRNAWGDGFYILQFQDPGVADIVLAENLDLLFRMFYAKAPRSRSGNSSTERGRGLNLLDAIQNADPDAIGPSVITEDDLSVYRETFRRTGFSGGLNWYRNIDRNWEITADLPDRVDVPALMISAADDQVLPPGLTAGMEQWVPDLEKHVIADCGHWTQQEKPGETNALILDWLQRRFPC